MDGELIKYLTYFWMLAAAGVGGVSFLVNLIGTAAIRADSETAAKFKRAEMLKCFLGLLLLAAVLVAALFLAQYMGSLTS